MSEYVQVHFTNGMLETVGDGTYGCFEIKQHIGGVPPVANIDYVEYGDNTSFTLWSELNCTGRAWGPYQDNLSGTHEFHPPLPAKSVSIAFFHS